MYVGIDTPPSARQSHSLCYRRPGADRNTSKKKKKKKRAREREREGREMALQWMILTYVVAVEAAIAVLLTIPSPKLVKSRIVSLVSLILQPSMFVVPFSAFQLLGLSLSFFLFIPPYLHLYGLLNWGPLNSFQDFGFLIRLYISSLFFFFFYRYLLEE